MKKYLTPLFLSVAFISTGQASGLETAKCATQTKDLEFFALDKNNHCRDLRKSCEYKGEFYSLGGKPENVKLRCAVPVTGNYDTLAKWLK